MKKNLRNILATSAVAGLALFGSAEKAKAAGPINVTTTITTNAGVVKYEWAVQNNSGYDVSDSLRKYTIDSNLQERQMHSFTNGSSPWSSSTNSTEDTYSWSANLPNSTPLGISLTKTFSAFIDETNHLGTVNVNSYGTSDNGDTDGASVGVPATAFPKKLYFDMGSKTLTWYSQANSLGRQFIIYKCTNLLGSTWGTNSLVGWNPVKTNTHSSIDTRYDYTIPITEQKAFFGVTEEQ